MVTDSTEEIHSKLRHAITDSVDPETTDFERAPVLDELSPGVANLYTILACCTKEEPVALIEQYHRKRYGHLKKAVAEAVEVTLAPIRAEYERIRKPENEGWLKEVANLGRERATAVAQQNLEVIKSRLGIGRI
jgi:tryptophanyl-tRNA synthetase